MGKARLLILDVGKAEAALRAAKIRCGREEAISVSLENRPGALAEAAKELAQVEVNIKSAYATTGCAGPTAIIVTVSNPSKALAAPGG